ncbi:FolC bifunctional protein [Biscogniauxia marginata]|nr:FolC bifunctional protein [Biscogniauxia marginata]
MVMYHVSLRSLIRTCHTPLITRNHILSLVRLNSTLRSASTMTPRTYDSALAHLSLLQSNRAIVSLFAPPPPSPSPPKPSSANPRAQDLNALAIPEVLAWLERAGISQERLAELKFIHVAGTKGKGSVCAYLISILTRAGDGEGVDPGRVGTYTSPHLVSVRERIQLDGRPISQELFAKYFFEVWDAFTASARAERSRRGGGEVSVSVSDAELEGPATKPFYFRFLTIMAFHVFLAEGVRSAVVECGIGGEYDSTNVLPPGAVTASVVSQLGIDHVGMLGPTLPEIAWHKAGVCKEGRKCFTRRLGGTSAEQETMRVLRRRAEEKGARLVELEDRDVEAWGGVRGDGCLEGEFQKYNQALAAAAAREHLRILGGGPEAQQPGSLAGLPAFVLDGLRRAKLRGRCETREDGDVTWLIDGAHTAESLDEVGRWFALKRRGLPGTARTVLLFNQQERDAPALLRRLLGSIRGNLETQAPGDAIFDEAVFTRNELRGRGDESEPERDLAVQRAGTDAMREISPATTALVVDNVAEAVAQARGAASRRGGDGRVAVLVTGSLHLVGALLRTLEPEAQL